MNCICVSDIPHSIRSGGGCISASHLSENAPDHCLKTFHHTYRLHFNTQRTSHPDVHMYLSRTCISHVVRRLYHAGVCEWTGGLAGDRTLDATGTSTEQRIPAKPGHPGQPEQPEQPASAGPSRRCPCRYQGPPAGPDHHGPGDAYNGRSGGHTEDTCPGLQDSHRCIDRYGIRARVCV